MRWIGGRHRRRNKFHLYAVTTEYPIGGLGLLLIDDQMFWNEETQGAMLWAFWYKWTSGAQFTFNFYTHCVTLVIFDAGIMGLSLHIN